MTQKEIKRRMEIATKHYDTWIEAELKVAENQSYSIGSRSLTRANLSEIRQEINFWEGQINKYENLLKNNGRNKIYIAVPKDI